MNENEAGQLVMSIILPHPTCRQIMVLREGEQQRLPQLQTVEDESFTIGMINQEVKRLWGLQTTVLREIAFAKDEASHRINATYLLEWHNVEHPLPTGLHWLNINELDTLTFLHPQQQEALATYVQEMESGIVPEWRMAWALPGWQANTEAWIRTQLAQLGCPVNSAIEQIKTGDSCVLRAPTECGQVYFKVTNTNPLLVNEATFTQALGRIFPDCIPTPLCIDPARRWMLLPDLGKVIGWEAPNEVYAAVFRDFARLQIASSTKIDELLAIGCIDRRLNQLAEQIDPFFADAEVMALVPPEIHQQLLTAAPKLKTLCAQLEACHVPATLVHGDLNMHNVTQCATFDTEISSLGDDTANTSNPTGAYIFFESCAFGSTWVWMASDSMPSPRFLNTLICRITGCYAHRMKIWMSRNTNNCCTFKLTSQGCTS